MALDWPVIEFAPVPGRPMFRRDRVRQRPDEREHARDDDDLQEPGVFDVRSLSDEQVGGAVMSQHVCAAAQIKGRRWPGGREAGRVVPERTPVFDARDQCATGQNGRVSEQHAVVVSGQRHPPRNGGRDQGGQNPQIA